MGGFYAVPSCIRTTDPDTALVSSLELNDILAPGGITGHSDQDGSGGGMAPDTNKATGCGPNPGLPCNLSWQHGLQISTQSLAMVGQGTQTWSSAEAGLNVILVPAGSVGHSNWHGPSGDMTLGHQ